MTNEDDFISRKPDGARFCTSTPTIPGLISFSSVCTTSDKKNWPLPAAGLSRGCDGCTSIFSQEAGCSTVLQPNSGVLPDTGFARQSRERACSAKLGWSTYARTARALLD